MLTASFLVIILQKGVDYGFIKHYKEKETETFRIYRTVKNRAECGFELTKTREFIKTSLYAAGLKPKTVGRGSVLAEISGGFEETVLLRADMDALPTEHGAAHLCGHHIHAASLLLAAELIFEKRDSLKRNIKFLFQAAEETLEGAKDSIDAGVLEAPAVNRAYMLHVLPALPLPVGTVIVSSPGITAPGALFFEIRIKGRSSHGSSPQSAIDALITGANVVQSLQNITASQLIGSDAVLTLGSFKSGSAPNVISDLTVIEGTMRSDEAKTLEKMKQRVEEMSENISSAYGATSEFSVKSFCPPLSNSQDVSEEAYRILSSIKGIKAVYSDSMTDPNRKKSTRGSEDFAFIAEKVPSVMIGVAAGEPKKDFDNPLHHPDVEFDSEALPVCTAVYFSLAMY